MADLEALIRYRKHGVDEKQRVLAALYREAEKFEQKIAQLQEEMAREKKLTDESDAPDAVSTYNLYAEGVRKKIKSLEAERAKLQIRVNAAQEAVREAFSEMKKAEITDRNRKNRTKKAAQKKEDQFLDEVAIDSFRRKQDEE